MNGLMKGLKAGFRWPTAAASPPQPKAPRSAAPKRQVAGLGDVIKTASSALGIQPCGGCQRRADWLNRKFPFQR